MKKCKQKHAIAFMQWRKYFDSNRIPYDDQDLKEIIDDRIDFMKKQHERRCGFIHSPDTIANEPIKNYEIYGFHLTEPG